MTLLVLGLARRYARLVAADFEGESCKLPKKMESYWSHGSETDSFLRTSKPPRLRGFRLVAGAGFEPATFGL